MPWMLLLDRCPKWPIRWPWKHWNLPKGVFFEDPQENHVTLSLLLVKISEITWSWKQKDTKGVYKSEQNIKMIHQSELAWAFWMGIPIIFGVRLGEPATKSLQAKLPNQHTSPPLMVPPQLLDASGWITMTCNVSFVVGSTFKITHLN